MVQLAEILFFDEPRKWRRWLETNHGESLELWVGFHKTSSGKPSISWPQAVDEALCFGWIDGLRKNLDATCYKIRFSPRKPGSIWSSVNVKRIEELSSSGRVTPSGLKAFEQRKEAKSGVYSYEQREAAKLDPSAEKQLRANRKAWEFFQSKAPSYRRAAIWWVVSAKQEATRLRRLKTLIEDCAHQRTIVPLTRKPG
jgi:uncharacterized protein YdeI (YjbR/CyaY-like superfamily)